MLNKQGNGKKFSLLTAVLIIADIAVSGFMMAADYLPKKNEADVSISENDLKEYAAKMPLHEKVCQMFVVRPEELTNGNEYTEAGSFTREYLRKYPVGGLICTGKNLVSQTQARKLINDIKQYAAEADCNPLFFCVDEEGGNVSRCANSVHTTYFKPMYSYKDKGTVISYANARTIGGDIGSLGFNVNFAPVADVWSNSENTVIGTRAYSDSFTQAAELIGSAVKGFRDSGVMCTLKHFPGHGDTAEDSHDGMAFAHKSADEIRENEYLPFISGINAGAEFVMVGHITVPEIDALPASLSEKVIRGELREKLGFEGLVITDGLGMGAVINDYGSTEAAVMAVEAGADLLLSPENFYEAADGVEEAVRSGRIPESRIDESVIRILAMKSRKMQLETSAETGDVNDDGAVDARDASAILAEYANTSSATGDTFTQKQNAAADVNGDGAVDARDASAVLAYYAASSAGGNITAEEFFCSGNKS